MRNEQGDVYAFDQAIDHTWVQATPGTSRLASFWMERRQIDEWLRAAKLRKQGRRAGKRTVQG